MSSINGTNENAHQILTELKALKHGERLNIKYVDIDSMQIPGDDPFAIPNRDEKIEWLHSQLFRDTKENYDSANFVAEGYYMFRR